MERLRDGLEPVAGDAPARRSRRRLLLAAAAVVALGLGVAAALVASERLRGEEVAGRPPATAQPTATATTPPATTAQPPATATAPPATTTEPSETATTTPATTAEPPPTQTTAPTTTAEPPPTQTTRAATTAPPPTSTAPPPATTPTPPGGETFVWPPVADTRAYEFQLFRADEQIFRARVPEPRLVLPRRWVHDGRSESLRPGSYRWYVWRISATTNRRVAEAIVQARLVVAGEGP